MNKGIKKFRRRIKEIFGFDIDLAKQKKGTNVVLCKDNINILNVFTVAQVRKRIEMIKDGFGGFEEYMNTILIYKGLPYNLSDIYLDMFLDTLCGFDPNMRLSKFNDLDYEDINKIITVLDAEMTRIQASQLLELPSFTLNSGL